MKPKRTILCIDGNEQALSIRKIFLQTRGYRVLCFTQPEEALNAVRRGGIDLVIAELALPGRTGSDLLDEVKRISPFTPTILLSSHVKIFDGSIRADVFLPKGSQTPAELLEHVRTLLVRKRGPRPMMPIPPLVAVQQSGKAAL